MIEDDINEQTEIVEFSCHSHIDVVKGVPFGFERSLPNPEQNHVWNDKSYHNHKKQDQEAVGVLIVTENKMFKNCLSTHFNIIL